MQHHIPYIILCQLDFNSSATIITMSTTKHTDSDNIDPQFHDEKSSYESNNDSSKSSEESVDEESVDKEVIKKMGKLLIGVNISIIWPHIRALL
jgi:hypothetical protein